MKLRLTRKKTKEQWLNDGEKHLLAKQYQQAIADFDRVIQLAPRQAVVYYSRGSAYLKLNEYQRAIADLDRAIELDPQDSEALYWRERALQRPQGK